MKKIPQLILIGGTGRNVGKTTLASKIIGHFSAQYPISGLKISNVKPGDEHLHGFHETQLKKNYVISQETEKGHKDSQRFLVEGARSSWYLRTKDEHLEEAFNDFSEQMEHEQLVVCESYTLRNYVEPGLFIMIQDAFDKEEKPNLDAQLKKADVVINALDSKAIEDLIESLKISDGQWVLSA